MEDGLLNRPTFMLLVIAFTALIVKAVIDYLGKRQLIARGVAPEELDSKDPKVIKWRLMSNLKWALIAIGFGGAVIVYESFPELLSTTSGFGLMFVGAGVGYLIYFFIAWRWSTKDNNRSQNGG